MNHLETMLRRAGLLLVALAALALLAVPATASAKSRHHAARDRNHDGLPDKWERKNHLSTAKRGVAKADPDKDGLSNLAEYRSHTNPRSADSNGNGISDASEDPDHDSVGNANEAREKTNPLKADTNNNGVKDGKEDADRDRLNNASEQQAATDPINPDSDGDGIKDGDEGAGRIVSFDGATLTIRLFGGSTLSGTLDENTLIDCSAGDGGDSTDDGSDLGEDGTDPAEARVRARLGSGRSSSPSSGQAGDPGAGDDQGVDDNSGDSSGLDDGSGDNGSADDGDTLDQGCSTDSLTVGAIVSEADVTVGADGTYFDAIELRP